MAEVGAASGADEGEEIDRIMKEIEDLEKRMDTDTGNTGDEKPAQAAQSQENPQEAPQDSVDDLRASFHTPIPAAEQENEENVPAEDPDESPMSYEPPKTSSKVVPMRPSLADSLAESDAVPARDEPLVRGGSHAAGDGGLSMKIGGCADVNLEFTRAGVSVTLSCTEDSLTISTDSGAEFRIPFKRSA